MADSQIPSHILEQLPPELLQRLKSSPRSLHRALFRIADAYTVASSLAMKQLKTTGNSDLGYPAVICASFALELLLKFFIAVEHPDRKGPEWVKLDALRGHESSKLWKRIAAHHRQAIVSSFRTRTGKQVDEAQFLKLLKDLGDDPFVRWRYAYERDRPMAMDLNLLSDVVNSLGIAAQAATRKAAGEPHG